MGILTRYKIRPFDKALFIFSYLLWIAKTVVSRRRKQVFVYAPYEKGVRRNELARTINRMQSCKVASRTTEAVCENAQHETEKFGSYLRLEI